MARPSYHHGDLRSALVEVAMTAVSENGPEAVSLRGLAVELGVSTAAPYRHFRDRRALLDEVAARGFRDLAAAYAKAQAAAPDARVALRETARAYLSLAFARPGLFKLMFASDILGAGAPASLLTPAAEAWAGLYRAVAAIDPAADEVTAKRRAIAGWSTLHGFIVLVQGGRLKGFMTEPLSEADLLEAVLDKALNEA